MDESFEITARCCNGMDASCEGVAECARRGWRQTERLYAIVVDLVSDLASTEATHDEVYYTWEGIVRRADGLVAEIIRNVSAQDDEWTWDRQLP